MKSLANREVVTIDDVDPLNHKNQRNKTTVGYKKYITQLRDNFNMIRCCGLPEESSDINSGSSAKQISSLPTPVSTFYQRATVYCRLIVSKSYHPISVHYHFKKCFKQC